MRQKFKVFHCYSSRCLRVQSKSHNQQVTSSCWVTTNLLFFQQVSACKNIFRENKFKIQTERAKVYINKGNLTKISNDLKVGEVKRVYYSFVFIYFFWMSKTHSLNLNVLKYASVAVCECLTSPSLWQSALYHHSMSVFCMS